jgi:hypothetical protein
MIELGLSLELMVKGEDKKKNAEQSLPNIPTGDLMDLTYGLC